MARTIADYLILFVALVLVQVLIFNHIMLFGLKKPLVAGERFPLSLQFERAGTVQVEVQVEAGAAQAHTEH